MCTSSTNDIFVFCVFQHLQFSFKNLLMCPWKLAPMWHYLVMSRVTQSQRSNGEDWTTCRFSQDPFQLVPSVNWKQALSLFQVGERMYLQVCGCAYVCMLVHSYLCVCLYILFCRYVFFVFTWFAFCFSCFETKIQDGSSEGFLTPDLLFSATVPVCIVMYKYVCSYFASRLNWTCSVTIFIRLKSFLYLKTLPWFLYCLQGKSLSSNLLTMPSSL